MKSFKEKPSQAQEVSGELWDCLLKINSEFNREECNVTEEFYDILKYEQTNSKYPRFGYLAVKTGKRCTVVSLLHSEHYLWVYPEGQYENEEMKDAITEIKNKVS